MRWFILFVLCVWSLISWADTTAWQAWRDGKAILIMRHALAPPGGDPSEFVLEDCSTQRNLNDMGREQSVAWGQYIRNQHTGSVQVYSSQWCRCLGTARLMVLDEVEPLPMLNSFFAGQGNRIEQTEDLLRMFSQGSVSKPTMLVTHQVNFTALTQIYPSSGEAAILALPLTPPVKVLARIEPR